MKKPQQQLKLKPTNKTVLPLYNHQSSSLGFKLQNEQLLASLYGECAKAPGVRTAKVRHAKSDPYPKPGDLDFCLCDRWFDWWARRWVSKVWLKSQVPASSTTASWREAQNTRTSECDNSRTDQSTDSRTTYRSTTKPETSWKNQTTRRRMPQRSIRSNYERCDQAVCWKGKAHKHYMSSIIHTTKGNGLARPDGDCEREMQRVCGTRETMLRDSLIVVETDATPICWVKTNCLHCVIYSKILFRPDYCFVEVNIE